MEKFESLVQKVESLLDRVGELSRAKEQLGRLLDEKEKELRAVKKQVSVNVRERARVRERVDELLGRIDRFIGQA